MADVFVSYSRSDEARVELLVRSLKAHGVTVWWDRSLEQGADFAALIRDEIAGAKAVLVCWSESAAGSRWVRAEADEADHQHKYVGALICPGRAPPPFNAVNNANLQHWQGAADDRNILELLRAVGQKIGRDDIAALAEAEDARLAAEERRKRAEAEAQNAQRVAQEHAESQAAFERDNKVYLAEVRRLEKRNASFFVRFVRLSIAIAAGLALLLFVLATNLVLGLLPDNPLVAVVGMIVFVAGLLAFIPVMIRVYSARSHRAAARLEAARARVWALSGGKSGA